MVRVMKIVLTYAATLNAKITKGDDADVSKWTSIEDKKHFKKLRSQFNLIIRSSKTYEVSKSYDKPRAGRLIVVLTRDPAKYESEKVDGQLEFSNEPVSDLIKRLGNQGYDKALLAVGGKISALFLQDKLINEFRLTLEPKMFGEGVNMIGEGNFEVEFKLDSMEKLNDKGTLLLTYSVIYN